MSIALLPGTGKMGRRLFHMAGGSFFPLPVDDNLTVPLLSGGIMTLVTWQGV